MGVSLSAQQAADSSVSGPKYLSRQLTDQHHERKSLAMHKHPTLETERLLLRPFTLEDAADVQRLVSERRIAATTMSFPHPYEDGMAEAWITKSLEQCERGKKLLFAMMCKGDGALVGSIALMAIEPAHQAEFGWWVGVPYWNKGFCTEAGHALLDYAFNELGLIRVHARHLSRNPSSGRVMQKLGMAYEGKRRSHVRKWGVFEDVELYGIVKSE
jgi:RimJ/RimL family protein N-acetyltransferase